MKHLVGFVLVFDSEEVREGCYEPDYFGHCAPP
jgi:hypothetical protein